MYRLCNQAFLYDHVTQIRYSSIKVCSILFWLGPDKIDHSLQLRALNALEKVVDFGVIVHATVAISIMVCCSLWRAT